MSATEQNCDRSGSSKTITSMSVDDIAVLTMILIVKCWLVHASIGGKRMSMIKRYCVHALTEYLETMTTRRLHLEWR